MEISIMNIPKISAIYFSLLQSGYDFYAVEKDDELVQSLEKFKLKPGVFESSFFSEAKQNTCEVYPYWPRVALLETATFFLDSNNQFVYFDAYRFKVMNAGNISDIERNISFWQWLRKFPSALGKVLSNQDFQSYLVWENEWIEQQKRLLENDLLDLQKVLSTCSDRFGSPIQKVTIVLNPIKCAYSADYHIIEDQLFFCSGRFQKEAVIHEFLHPIVHPFVMEHEDIILQQSDNYPDLDPSYYLTGDELGRLNAFEEHLVRKLTTLAVTENLPVDIGKFIKEILAN